MSAENESVSNVNLEKCSVVLVDVAGTTTSNGFVKETLLPYALSNVEEYLKANWEQENIKSLVKQLKEKEEITVEKAVELFKTLNEKDENNKTVKELQGLIYKKGYEDGTLKAHVFTDVPEALENWAKTKRVAVYSSGSVESQKLLFAHTTEGDISKHISHYFDLSVGDKSEGASYEKIAKELTIAPEELVYINDDINEANAAKKSSVTAVLIKREGNKEISEEEGAGFTILSSFANLPIESSGKRKNEEQEAPEAPPSKLAKTEEESKNTETAVEAKEEAKIEVAEEAMEVDSTELVNETEKKEPEAAAASLPETPATNNVDKKVAEDDVDMVEVETKEKAKEEKKENSNEKIEEKTPEATEEKPKVPDTTGAPKVDSVEVKNATADSTNTAEAADSSAKKESKEVVDKMEVEEKVIKATGNTEKTTEDTENKETAKPSDAVGEEKKDVAEKPKEKTETEEEKKKKEVVETAAKPDVTVKVPVEEIKDTGTNKDQNKPQGKDTKETEVISAKKPEVSSAKKPEVSSAKKPEVSSAKEPEVNSAKKPEVSTAKKPEVNSDKKPEVSSKKKAESSGNEKQEDSVCKKPEVSSKIAVTKGELKTDKQKNTESSTSDDKTVEKVTPKDDENKMDTDDASEKTGKSDSMETDAKPNESIPEKSSNVEAEKDVNMEGESSTKTAEASKKTAEASKKTEETPDSTEISIAKPDTNETSKEKSAEISKEITEKAEPVKTKTDAASSSAESKKTPSDTKENKIETRETAEVTKEDTESKAENKESTAEDKECTKETTKTVTADSSSTQIVKADATAEESIEDKETKEVVEKEEKMETQEGEEATKQNVNGDGTKCEEKENQSDLANGSVENGSDIKNNGDVESTTEEEIKVKKLEEKPDSTPVSVEA